MPKLSCYKNIEGVQANTVVVDMAAGERAVELAEELPLRHLYEARNKANDAIHMVISFMNLVSLPIIPC